MIGAGRWSRPCLLLALVLAASPALGQGAAAGETELVDRVLAVVDEDPILESELQQVVALGLAAPEEDEEDEAFRRRLLDRMIEQKLRFHEIDRYGFAEVPLEEVEEQFDTLRTEMGGGDAMARKLEQLGLDETGVRQLLARQLMVLIYVEERLGPRVLIGLEEIQAYYDETLVPEMRSRGEEVPPVAEIREDIRELLRQRRLDDEIELWTEELRLEADIEDYLESSHEDLPSQLLERNSGTG